jgi:hypothetical protein
MKERPILFSAPMVRAILSGSKSQTRRIVKQQPERNDKGTLMWGTGRRTGLQRFGVDGLDVPPGVFARCPYGQTGDRLWVRETFDFLPDGGPDEPQACVIVYWATGSTEPRSAPESYNPMIYGREKVRPSIHMPRWASRIALEVTGVRVERLQDISEADARAEGALECDPVSGREVLLAGASQRGSFVLHYRDIWGSINGAGSWATNPWVWVIEFRRLP